MSNFDDVKTFMQTFGQEVKIKTEFPEEKIVKLRYNLIKEELNELQNAGHALAFTLVAFCLAHGLDHFRPLGALLGRVAARDVHLQRPVSKVKYSLLVLVLAVVIGGGVELVQSGIGREMSASDLLLDVLGSCAGVALYFASLRSSNLFSPQGFSVGFRLSSSILMLLFLLVSFAKTALCYFSLDARDRAFPILFDGESFLVNRFVSAAYGASVSFEFAPLAWKNNKTKVLKLTVPPGNRWPSLVLSEPVLNWRHYDALYFEIYSEHSDVISATLRVNDTEHNNFHGDRFNQAILVKPGVNYYTFPLEVIESGLKCRAMDLGRVSKVMWFVGQQSETHTLYFDNIRLK